LETVGRQQEIADTTRCQVEKDLQHLIRRHGCSHSILLAMFSQEASADGNRSVQDDKDPEWWPALNSRKVQTTIEELKLP
ncbi:hypothetical protein AB6A40_007820, partial [Gnathostoma spinigerum]